MQTSRTPIMQPPLPPAPVNTLALATGGLMLSMAVTGTYCAAQFFRFLDNSGHLFENFLLLLTLVPTAILGLVFGVIAMVNESRRKQFQLIVWNYTRATGDARYMPYILPVHYNLVVVMSVTSLLLPCLGLMVSTYFLGRMV